MWIEIDTVTVFDVIACSDAQYLTGNDERGVVLFTPALALIVTFCPIMKPPRLFRAFDAGNILLQS